MQKRDAGRLLGDLLSGRVNPEVRLRGISAADGERLVDWALRFKVASLLYREVISSRLPDGLIPPPARRRLRDAYRTQATINTSLFMDGGKVLQTLAEHGIPVIALKGLALAHSIYEDRASRPMSDLDLLVKEEDLIRAGHVLLKLGYRQPYPAWESLAAAYHHLPDFANRNGTRIELHRNIAAADGPLRIDLGGLWDRARPIRIENLDILALAPEDLLLHLCIHAGHHLQTGLDLIPFCDIAGTIRKMGAKVDWLVLRERAVGWGSRKCVYMMLLLTKELLGAAPRDEILSAFRPDDFRPGYFDDVVDHILDENPEIASGLSYSPEICRPGQLIAVTVDQLSQIHKLKGLMNKASALARKAFPSKRNLASKYPVPISSLKIYLCYGSRLSRLMIGYAAVLLRLSRRDASVQHAVRRAHRTSTLTDWLFSG